MNCFSQMLVVKLRKAAHARATLVLTPNIRLLCNGWMHGWDGRFVLRDTVYFEGGIHLLVKAEQDLQCKMGRQGVCFMFHVVASPFQGTLRSQ